jgi:nucleoside-diphosphate-sugar epimerase
VSERRCLIAGCGDLGTRLGLLLAQSGAQVFGLRRGGALPPPLIALRADLTGAGAWPELPGALDAVVFCPAPSERSESAYRALYRDGLERLLGRLDGHLKPFARIVLVSSSAVWGELAGAWVDELTPTQPQAFNGQVLLEAEHWLLAQAYDGVVVRLSGIYGPGRDALARRAQTGAPICAEPPNWTNRIHVDDAARAIAHVLALPDCESIYLGVDDMPAPQHEVLDFIAGRLHLPLLPRVPAAAPMGNKRLSNRRLRLTGFDFRYPDYRAGYSVLL